MELEFNKVSDGVGHLIFEENLIFFTDHQVLISY